jgi:hypothetical protein
MVVKTPDSLRNKFPSACKTAAGAFVAGLLAFSPLTERSAYAQERPGQSQPDHAGAQEEQKEPPRAEAPADAGARADGGGNVDSGGEWIATTGPSSSTLDSRTDEEAHADDFSDPLSCPFHNDVAASGRRRSFTLDNQWDIGGGAISIDNVASSIYADVLFTLRRRPDREGWFSATNRNPLYAGFRAGNMWFGEQAAPFARLFLSPRMNIWRFKAASYHTVGVVGDMPSYLYTSHYLGFGFGIPFDNEQRYWIRTGIVGGGALSYPAWDDIYFNMVPGISLELDRFLLYATVPLYFAAETPTQTAFVGYYEPRFQSVEFGAQFRFPGDQYALRAYGEVGTIYQRTGLRLSRSWNVTDDVSVDAYGSAGFTHWSDFLGGRYDPAVMAGLRVVFGGQHVNSTVEGRYEHLTNGGVARNARIDIPTRENPGPYGYGRAGNPSIDDQVNLAKERILAAGSFEAFSASYSGASQSEVIMAARFMGAFLQQVAYANNAFDALNNVRQFDPEVQRIADSDSEQKFRFIQRYVDFYNTHSPSDPLPEDLRNGIAVCAGIHELMAEFLNQNGVPAVVASVNTQRGPHVVAIGEPGEGTTLLNYGDAYQTPPGTFDQAIRLFGQEREAPTFQSQIFDFDEETGRMRYRGTYITAEGRLLHETIGIVNTDMLMRDFLGVR